MTPMFKGRLLVAAPSLRDPNFERTVVLVVEHGDDGAVGVVLNRPSEAAVSEILPAWHHMVVEPAVVFVGGPVALSGAICLGRSGSQPDGDAGWRRLFGDLGIVDLDADPGGFGGPSDAAGGVRVFAGHAGWGPGQLEGEVEVGAWFVLDAWDDDASTAEPESLWSTVLRRQGGAMARVANFPDDPSAN